MNNKLGTTENMVEYHENGKLSYEFRTYLDGISIERTFDKYGRILTIKRSDGVTFLYTRDEQGNELAYKNSNGYYEVKDKVATKEEYEAFILLLSLEKPKEQTVVNELIDLIPDASEIIEYISENNADEKMLDTWLWERMFKDKKWLEKEKEQIQNVFEHCWNHPNWKGDYDIKDMNDYINKTNNL